MVKKLSFEMRLYKKLAEIKNLRHAGLWRENRAELAEMPHIDEVSTDQEISLLQELEGERKKEGDDMQNGSREDRKVSDEDESSVYDWIVDIDMISNVRDNYSVFCNF